MGDLMSYVLLPLYKGSNVAAASTSRAKFLNQYLFLWSRLYFSPLFKSFVSSSVNEMFVILITLG